MVAVVIVDDHPVVRAGMQAILDTADAITIVVEGATGADALRLVAQHRPDVLVLDVRLCAVLPGRPPRPLSFLLSPLPAARQKCCAC